MKAVTAGEIAAAMSSYAPSRRVSLKYAMHGREGKREFFVTDDLAVKFFTFLGDERTKPFTMLSTYYRGRRWSVSLDRSYEPCWWQRLANNFARAILQKTGGKS
jgi:hypothetical protein